ncbi:MAG: glycosyltransferase family 4 protein [Ignavibacteria bacterium]
MYTGIIILNIIYTRYVDGMNNNILIITNELKHVCGVSNHIKNLVNGFDKKYGNYNFILLCGKKEEGIDEFYKCNIIINDNLLHSRRNILSIIRSVFFVRKIINQYNIGIIHSHNHYAANISRQAAVFKRTKTVQTNHGILKEAGRLNHFNADYYVVLSERIRNHLLSLGISANKIRIIKQGISETYIPKQKNQNEKLIVFSASRYTEEKSMDVYINAANIISKELPGLCDFFISGEGELEEKLKNLNNAKGGAVKFVNPKSDYRDTLKKAHIFVFNSIKEGTPIVLLEALFSGCKVITSSFEGYDEVLKVAKNLIVYEPENLDELRAKLKQAIQKYSGNEDANFIQENLMQEYSLTNMISKHNELYSEILKEK